MSGNNYYNFENVFACN